MRCLGRIGCAVVLLVLGAAGWHFRDLWLPRVRALVEAELPWEDGAWKPITAEGAQKVAAQMARLDRRTGPAFVNVDGADLMAYALRGALTGIQAVDSLPEVLVDSGVVHLRIRVKLTELGGTESLGAVAGLFGATERVTISGRLSLVRPGLLQFLPTQVAVKDLKVPPRALDRLFGRWSAGTRHSDVPLEALAFSVPGHIGDLRINDSRITLYKGGA